MYYNYCFLNYNAVREHENVNGTNIRTYKKLLYIEYFFCKFLKKHNFNKNHEIILMMYQRTIIIRQIIIFL